MERTFERLMRLRSNQEEMRFEMESEGRISDTTFECNQEEQVGRAVPARQKPEFQLQFCSASGGHGPPLFWMLRLLSNDSPILGRENK